MLMTITIIEWLRLFGGIIAFLGPGFCITVLFFKNSIKNITHWFVLSIVASLGMWGIILAWLKIFDLSINIVGVWVFFLSGWIIGFIFLFYKKNNIDRNRFNIRLPESFRIYYSTGNNVIPEFCRIHDLADPG